MAELLAANQITIAKVLDGEQGIPGEPGADGKTSYFHIKYSAVSNPTSSSEMSETPLAYIGTYVDFTEADSTDPTKYTWSRFEGIQGEKGEQGIPGIGQDGKTSYLHIAYATSADGSEGFSISESANKTYIGQYTDFVSTDSTDYTKYAWTKIKGEMSPEQVAQLNKASQDASDAVSKVDNLDIVGINLLLNSGFKNNADEWFTYGITDYIVKDGKQCAHMNFSVLKAANFVRQSLLEKLKPDTQYTMSAWVLTENVVKGTTNFACMFYHDGYYNNNGSSKWYSYGSKELPLNAGEWTHLEWTFTTDSTKLLSSTVSDIYLYARDMTGDIYFCDLKLEKGNKATDWTPAPEDVDAGIANAQTKADEAYTKARDVELTKIDRFGTNASMKWDGNILKIEAVDPETNVPYAVEIGGNGIEFKYDNEAVAMINQDQLVIDKTVVLTEMQVNRYWTWRTRDNNNLCLQWIGGGN